MDVRLNNVSQLDPEQLKKVLEHDLLGAARSALTPAKSSATTTADTMMRFELIVTKDVAFSYPRRKSINTSVSSRIGFDIRSIPVPSAP